MTNDSATTAPRARDASAAPAQSAPTPSGPAEAVPRLAGVAALASLVLAWLAAMLWVAHSSISSDVGVVALATAASSLPPVVSAAVLAGAAVGLLASGLTVRGTSAASAGRAGIRFGCSVTAGALTGLAAGAAFILGSGTDPARMAVAGTLAAGATIGGAVAGARAARVVTAVVAAGLAVFATGFVLGLFKGQVLGFYGAGDDEASQLSAAGWFAATAAVASGLAAGLTAYRVLGGARRDPALRWPAYLLAGAGPGAMLLVTELIIRTGGAKLLGLVREISDADRTLQTWAGGSRVNNGLVVLFLGAVVAIIALGRTLGPAAPDDDGPDDDETSALNDEARTDDRLTAGRSEPVRD